MRKTDDGQVEDMLPRSVEIVKGDVGDPSTLKAAVEGCNKIIYCATARSTITGDLYRVDHRGVYNLSKAFQVISSYYRFFYFLFFSKNEFIAFQAISLSCYILLTGLQQQTSTIASRKKQQKQAPACQVQVCRFIEWMGSK